MGEENGRERTEKNLFTAQHGKHDRITLTGPLPQMEEALLKIGSHISLATGQQTGCDRIMLLCTDSRTHTHTYIT